MKVNLPVTEDEATHRREWTFEVSLLHLVQLTLADGTHIQGSTLGTLVRLELLFFERVRREACVSFKVQLSFLRR